MNHKAIFATHPEVVVIRGESAFDKDGNAVNLDSLAISSYESGTGYIEQRLKAYPPIEEQLDMIFHGGLETWKNQIQKIKDKFPKS